MVDKLTTDAEKTSYALGLDVATSLKKMPLEIDIPSFNQAFADVFAGSELLLGQDEFATVMQEFQTKLQAEAQKIQAELSAKNEEIAGAFLAENAAKDGVTTTESGLQYSVITAGDGAQPTSNDTVTVHYTGTLPDGTKFDSSVDRGEPATFPLSGVIAGWTEGVQLMNVGSKFQFVVPANLAYGDRGAGQLIGPGATLVFEVELIAIG